MKVSELFKKQFKDLSIEPAPEVWDRLSQQLDASIVKSKESKKPSKKIILRISTWASIAAILIIGVFITLRLQSPSLPENGSSSNIANYQSDSQKESVLQKETETLPVTTDKKYHRKKIARTKIQTSLSQKGIVEEETSAKAEEIIAVAIEEDSNTNRPRKWRRKRTPAPVITESELAQNVAEIMKAHMAANSGVLGSLKHSYPSNIPTYLDRVVGNKYHANTALASTNKALVLSALQVSDIVTPNDDGINDTWEIYGLENYNSYSLVVTTVKGNIVFRSDNYTNDWGGEDLATGSYFYVLKVNYDNGGEMTKKGLVSILR